MHTVSVNATNEKWEKMKTTCVHFSCVAQLADAKIHVYMVDKCNTSAATLLRYTYKPIDAFGPRNRDVYCMGISS